MGFAHETTAWKGRPTKLFCNVWVYLTRHVKHIADYPALTHRDSNPHEGLLSRSFETCVATPEVPFRPGTCATSDTPVGTLVGTWSVRPLSRPRDSPLGYAVVGPATGHRRRNRFPCQPVVRE